MPPPLALLLCTAFVVYLLRFDRRHTPGVSRALWIPTIWMFSVSTKPVGVWFAYGGGDENSSPLDQYFQISLLCLGLGTLARRRFDWGRAIRSQPWVMALLAYMLASTLWSDIALTSFKRWVRELVALVMAFVVLSQREPRQAVESILRRSAYILVPFSLLLIKYFPDYGVEYGRWSGERMWVGVAQQKNGLARVCIVAVLFLVWSLVRRWRQHDVPGLRYHTHAEVGVLVLALFLLLTPEGKTSATAIVALALGVVTLMGLLWLEKHRVHLGAGAFMAVTAAVIGFGVALPLSGGTFGSGFSEALGRDTTFTGRAEVWADITEIAMRHPVLGCGFGGYWTSITRDLHRMSHAHSAYLELLNELGFVGLLLFAAFLLAFARNGQRALALDQGWGSLCISFLFMALLHGATESSINQFASQLGAMLLFLAVSCAPAAERLREREPQGGPLQREMSRNSTRIVTGVATSEAAARWRIGTPSSRLEQLSR
jgi:O-antigen ligase